MPHLSVRDTQSRKRTILPPQFGWRRTTDDQATATIAVTGELDMATTPELAQALSASLLRSRLVVVDLRQLAFIDSGGVRAVVKFTSEARGAGRRVVLLLGASNVERVFALTGSRGHIEPVELSSLGPSVQALLD